MDGVVFSSVFLSFSSSLFCSLVILSHYIYIYYCGFYINISLRSSVFLFLISVLELHQNSTLEYPPKKQSKKSDHLVLGPAAGQGLPNRLQCEGSCSPFPYNMAVLSPQGF